MFPDLTSDGKILAVTASNAKRLGRWWSAIGASNILSNQYEWRFPKIGLSPKSLIVRGFSIINHPFWGSTIYGNPHMPINFDEHWPPLLPVRPCSGSLLGAPTAVMKRWWNLAKWPAAALLTSNPCCSPVRKGKSIGSCLGATCKNFWWRLEHGWMRGKLLRGCLEAKCFRIG